MTKNIIIITTSLFLILTAFLVFKFGLNKKGLKDPNDFSSGVLAINTDKSIYLLGETVKIQMSALDSHGNVLCNAKLSLQINGSEEKQIKTSPTCSLGSVTSNPDYFVNYTPQKTGNYEIKLKNLETNVSAMNKFEVSNERDLDIVRETAVRINPNKNQRYAVRLIVTAKNDYSGEISDLIPNGFSIPWQGPAKVEGNKISWQVNLKAGETKEFIYEYLAPTTSPSLYYFGKGNKWQVVAAN
jgi:hypothetical protein